VAVALRVWLIGSGAIAAGLALWAFAPPVIFLLLLTGALGAVSALMIALARLLRGRIERGGQMRKGEGPPSG
jgi:hypothetical protein